MATTNRAQRVSGKYIRYASISSSERLVKYQISPLYLGGSADTLELVCDEVINRQVSIKVAVHEHRNSLKANNSGELHD